MEKIDGIIDGTELTTLRANTSNASLAGTSANPDSTAIDGWFEAMAKAWGNSLDEQAADVVRLSQQLGEGGNDTPSNLTLLTAESMRMQFLANSASTSMKSVAQALEALARKQ